LNFSFQHEGFNTKLTPDRGEEQPKDDETFRQRGHHE
jgi:hypothetical protein